MRYIDVDYVVKNSFTNTIPKESDILDVYFVRKPHFCKKTNQYWDNKCDESIYLTVKEENSNIERTICLAKNQVSESEIYFEDDEQKKAFYDEFRDNEFYNHLTVYCPLSEKQAVQFLGIMSRNIDNYDYNFQYSDPDIAVKNIIGSCLNKSSAVSAAYDLYLELSKESQRREEIDYMLKEATTDNVIAFSSKVSKQ